MQWIGTQLGEAGRYTLESMLGQGAMGLVFLATDSRLRRRVVVKVLSPTLCSNTKVRERFFNEALIQANLTHANIVRAVDVLEHGDMLAIVMEYANGPDLERYAAEMGGRIPLDMIGAIMLPVMSAVSYAHANGVVHRDLKPSNIMLDRTTGEDVPKVGDFGVAKILSEGSNRTRAGATIGTPSYMPPEQLRGLAVDHRADVYAMGAMLYQLATGCMPFGQGNEYDVTHRVLSGHRPPPPSSLVPGLPRAFDDVVERAMANEAGERHQSVDELRSALAAALAGGHADPSGKSTAAGSPVAMPQAQDHTATEVARLAVEHRSAELEPTPAQPSSRPALVPVVAAAFLVTTTVVIIAFVLLPMGDSRTDAASRSDPLPTVHAPGLEKPAAPREPADPRPATAGTSEPIGPSAVAAAAGGALLAPAPVPSSPVEHAPPAPPPPVSPDPSARLAVEHAYPAPPPLRATDPYASEAESATAAYLALVRAYNTRDREGYFGAMEDPLDFFYGRRNMPVTKLRKARSTQFDEGGASLRSNAIRVAEKSRDRVVLTDQGSLTKRNGDVAHFVKGVLMRRIGGRWLMTGEVTRDTNCCLPDSLFSN